MPEPDRAAERRAAGLCTSCGSEPHVPGRTRCERCLEDARERARERRERAARGGLCEACMRRRRAAGRGNRCAACADRYLARQLDREREKRRADHD